MSWLTVLLTIVFGCMIVSPAYFFRKVDKLLFEEDNTVTAEFPCATGIMPANDYKLDHEMSRLANFDRMIAFTKNEDAKRIWELKKTEYLRELNWRRLTENAYASERKQLTS